MKVSLILTLALLFVAMATGCAIPPRTPVCPPYGLFNHTGAPLNLQYKGSDVGEKQGKATATSILHLFSYGDCSIAAAAKDGGITTIKHADAEFFNILGIFAQYRTIAYGD